MKYKRKIWGGGMLLLLVACTRWITPNSYVLYPKEATLSFSESIQHQTQHDLLERILWYKFAGVSTTDYVWLRKPKHLWTAYNVVKQIGLEHFVSRDRYTQDLYDTNFWDYHWQGMSLAEVVQELRSTYHEQHSDTANYFHKFWNRRKADGTATVMMSILTDVSHFYAAQEVLPVNSATLNDTLLSLLAYNVALNESDSTNRANITYAYFEYLRGVGLEHSAHNLLFAIPATAEVVLDKESLEKRLEGKTVSKEKYREEYRPANWVLEGTKGP